MSDWCLTLFHEKLVSYIMAKTSYFIGEMVSASYCGNTLSWMFIVPAHWSHNSTRTHSTDFEAISPCSFYSLMPSTSGKQKIPI